MKTIDASAALGAAALVVSTAALLATHAPDINKVSKSTEGSGVATDLRVAELSTGAMVLLAGAVGSYIAGGPWPILLALTAVGGAIAVYEAFLYFQRP